MPKTVIQVINEALEDRAMSEFRVTKWGTFGRSWSDVLEFILQAYLPSRQGFEGGTDINARESRTSSRIVFSTTYRHVDANGEVYRCTNHKVIVKPAFGGISVSVTGEDINNVKKYIAKIFQDALLRRVEFPRYRSDPYDSPLRRTREAPRRITLRERQVLSMAVSGKTSKQIAVILGLSHRTVEAHRGRAIRKLGVNSIAQLTRYARENGLSSIMA